MVNRSCKVALDPHEVRWGNGFSAVNGLPYWLNVIDRARIVGPYKGQHTDAGNWSNVKMWKQAVRQYNRIGHQHFRRKRTGCRSGGSLWNCLSILNHLYPLHDIHPSFFIFISRYGRRDWGRGWKVICFSNVRVMSERHPLILYFYKGWFWWGEEEEGRLIAGYDFFSKSLSKWQSHHPKKQDQSFTEGTGKIQKRSIARVHGLEMMYAANSCKN